MSEHTPGAVRAAEKIWEDMLDRHTIKWALQRVEEEQPQVRDEDILPKFAQIIDDETGLKELIEAAGKARTEINGLLNSLGEDEIEDSFQEMADALDLIDAAISKAKGKS